MSRRVGLILSIIISIGTLAILIVRVGMFSPRNDIDAYDKVTVLNDHVYVTRNTPNEGFLFRLKSDGRVDKAYNIGNLVQGYAESICNDGENIILMTVGENEGEEVNPVDMSHLVTTVTTKYRISVFSEGLDRLKQSPALIFDDNEKIRNIRADSAKIYITALSLDGSKAKLFVLDKSELYDIDPDSDNGLNSEADSDDGDREEECLELDAMLVREAPAGRFFSDADYENGAITVRMDNEAPEGGFAVGANIREIVSNIRMTFLQKLAVQRSVTQVLLPLVVIGLLIIIAFIIAIVGRNRVVYTAVIVELVLIGILMANFFFTTTELKNTSRQESARFVLISIQSLKDDLGDLTAVDWYAEDFYDSEDYRRLQSALSHFVTKSGNSSLFRDCMLVDLSSGQSLVSAGGMNRQNVSEVYGQELGEALEEINNGNSYSLAEFMINGEDFFCLGLNEEPMGQNIALFGIAIDSDTSISLWGDRRTTVSNYVMIFIMGSLLCLFIIYIQSEDMRLFEKEIAKVAGLDTNVERPILMGRDMVSIWNSLTEIAKQIDRMNYAKYRIYEAYYRFAPKNIETILKKTSITEVHSGDSINVRGTLAFAATRFNSADELVNFLGEKKEKERQGIIVSSNSELNLFKILFLQENTKVTSFGIDYIKRNGDFESNKGQTVLLYFGSFTYGISGTADQSFAYLASDENQELEMAVRWLKDRKVGLVITEDVKLREAIEYKTRYIGYLELSTGKIRLNLYEVLDACPSRERQQKLFYLDRFGKALDLFYRKDFYLARSEFSEILKGFPEDEIVRWYLFESERCLNDNSSFNDSGALGGMELASIRKNKFRMAGEEKINE